MNATPTYLKRTVSLFARFNAPKVLDQIPVEDALRWACAANATSYIASVAKAMTAISASSDRGYRLQEGESDFANDGSFGDPLISIGCIAPSDSDRNRTIVFPTSGFDLGATECIQ